MIDNRFMTSCCCRPRAASQAGGRVDERQVGERLREIPKLPAGHGAVFLHQQADVVAAGEQAIEQRPRFLLAALQDVVVRQQEAVLRGTEFSEQDRQVYRDK